jgi:hypothetical protein
VPDVVSSGIKNDALALARMLTKAASDLRRGRVGRHS